MLTCKPSREAGHEQHFHPLAALFGVLEIQCWIAHGFGLLDSYEVAPSLCSGFRHAARTPRKRLNMDSALLACYEVAPSLCSGFRHAARTPRKRLNMDSAPKRSEKRKGTAIGCASCLTLSLYIQNSRFHRVIGTWFATLFCEQDQQVRGN